MEVSIKLEGVEQVKEKYNPQQINKAIKFALKNSIRSGKTEASSDIRDKLGFNIKKSDLDKKISTKYNETKAEISVVGEPILMSYFNPTQIGDRVKTQIKTKKGKFELTTKRTRKQATGGVQVQIIKGQQTIISGGNWQIGNIEGVFIARGQGGAPLVFGREASGKLIALKVYGQEFMFKKILDLVADKVVVQWQKEFSNQIKQLEAGTATWI
jgi:hypothetical protein